MTDAMSTLTHRIDVGSPHQSTPEDSHAFPAGKRQKGCRSSSQDDSILETMMASLCRYFPKYKPYIEKVTPALVKCGNMVDTIYPYVEIVVNKCKVIWYRLQPYNPQQFSPLLFGLLICFFGGYYATLIAAFECVRLVIWQRMYVAFSVLVKNYKEASEASREDDLMDEDNNGISDVNELAKKELLSRKINLFLRTINPDEVTEAASTIWAGMLSVVATLRVHLAQSITLGCSVGEVMDNHLRRHVEPLIACILPTKMKAWGPVGTGYVFRIIGCTVAWFLRRILIGFHAAVRGADMFVSNAIIIGHKHKYIPDKIAPKGPHATAMASLVAFMGFYWQVSNNFGLPFPLNLVFFPVTLAEWLLSTIVSIM
eukprot:Tbor_TRINITY_DN5158_c0_g3::TRINITY_DN5158_c0_g3_i1::g.25753::m.25753